MRTLPPDGTTIIAVLLSKGLTASTPVSRNSLVFRVSTASPEAAARRERHPAGDRRAALRDGAYLP